MGTSGKIDVIIGGYKKTDNQLFGHPVLSLRPTASPTKPWSYLNLFIHQYP